ncbi:MAG: PP2C family protein-serine/threonine phosphatase, partial [Methanocorpusculum sp.]|nr:PP2C family protein-serine/threonine phosphatase [Methanocorpusculum sp.]
SNEACMFVTVFFGIIYPYGKFVYSCAGHNPPLILRDNEISELRFTKAPVIGIEEYSYKNSEIELEDGDTVFLYTDGLTESVRKFETGEEEIYGINRLKAAVKKGKIAEEIISAVRADYNEFTSQTEQFDDVTMLAFTYHR